MESSDIPIVTEEVFEILKPWLPLGTYMSSAYRDANYQLKVIQMKAGAWNTAHPNEKIPLPNDMVASASNTWLPTLVALRKLFDINAPFDVLYQGKLIGATPHHRSRPVFDLSHPQKSIPKIHEILRTCVAAEKRGLVMYNQLKPETKHEQMAVHVDVKWVSPLALQRLWAEMGFANT